MIVLNKLHHSDIQWTALSEMVSSDDWAEHAVHREAGLEGQLNICSKTPPA
jgi:hypothetical protein